MVAVVVFFFILVFFSYLVIISVVARRTRGTPRVNATSRSVLGTTVCRYLRNKLIRRKGNNKKKKLLLRLLLLLLLPSSLYAARRRPQMIYGPTNPLVRTQWIFINSPVQWRNQSASPSVAENILIMHHTIWRVDLDDKNVDFSQQLGPSDSSDTT